ncbi:hypothetical protein D9756_000778 [Leucocoprinus leucothites]|uniref:FAD-binding PCMH-type domain-containing protein n=1 Tax=Leucocoprinus leucothites TaxID=201217 RepID=A0A8H5GFX7_9AGAR|nr:hypothetical protein D9756_000778 [Leucoagaricus leucothites]
MTTILDLVKRVKGDVITPENPDYAKSVSRWACSAEKKAAAVVFVKDESDIAESLSFARDNSLPVAVRGGGHNPTGASSVEAGVVIDLSRYFHGVHVDPEKKLAYVGGGAVWNTVDKAAIEHGLATVGGTVSHTGVGGLVLGGGFGWLSGEHGLAVDNLVQVTLVSADGVVHTANEAENPDLFFGVRGGGCNFGVVTEFVLALHSQRRTVFAGPVIFSGDKLKIIIEAAKDWYSTASAKEGIALMTTCDAEGKPIIVCNLFFNGSEQDGRRVYQKIFNIEPLADLTQDMPYEAVNTLQDNRIDYGSGIYWKGVAYEGPNYESMAKAHEAIVRAVKSGGVLANAIYEWIPLQKINAVPLNATAFCRRPNPNCLIIISWHRDANSEGKVDQARDFAYDIAECVVGGLSALKDVKSQAYSNYDPEGVAGGKDEVKDKARVLFGDNYETLQGIKRKFDPENVFNRWFAITPA